MGCFTAEFRRNRRPSSRVGPALERPCWACTSWPEAHGPAPRGLYSLSRKAPTQLRETAERFGIDLGAESGIEIHYTTPVELLASRWLDNAVKLIEKTGATRVMIDSLSAMQMGLPEEQRFRELVYTMVKMFKNMGVTLIMTSEAPELLGYPFCPATGSRPRATM